MRMTDSQQDADRKDRRTQAWLEHCAACFDELLAACKAIREAFDANDSHGIREEIERSRAAIARAESRPVVPNVASINPTL